MSDGIQIDISGFILFTEHMEQVTFEAIARGAGKAGIALLNDTLTELPATPLDEGTLRGSGSVLVDNRLLMEAPNVGGEPTPATEDDVTLDPDAVVVAVGFNTPYAAVQHEGERKDGSHKIKNYSHSGTGAKFLEKKQVENWNDYQKIVAEEVRAAHSA